MRKVHFIGIAGVGMSALAQLFRARGDRVTGSDSAWFPTLVAIEKLGIPITIGYRAENIPADTEWVVYTDAAHQDNAERTEAARRKLRSRSYFEALGDLSKEKRTVAVSGTHGKTTTTGMLAKILSDAGESPTAVVGSIVKDFGSNYLGGTSDLLVVEACEYKNHLLELSPEMLVVTNLEWDHTDFFPSLAALQDTFRTAIARVPSEGAVVTDATHPNIAPLLADAKARIIDYTKEPSYELRLPGEFNKMNARAASAAARLVRPDLADEAIARSLADFHGTWRRFEYKGKTAHGAEVYDDYAHHPTAIIETLRALRAKTRGKVFVAFHPHLFSRTRDLLEDFGKAFADADEVLVAPIYAARESDDGSISSEKLAARIRANGINARPATFEEIIAFGDAVPREGDAIMTMGAGDIFKVADALARSDKKTAAA